MLNERQRRSHVNLKRQQNMVTAFITFQRTIYIILWTWDIDARSNQIVYRWRYAAADYRSVCYDRDCLCFHLTVYGRLQRKVGKTDCRGFGFWSLVSRHHYNTK